MRSVFSRLLDHFALLALIAVLVWLYMELVPDSIGLLWKLLGAFALTVVGLSLWMWWADRRAPPDDDEPPTEPVD